MALNVDLTSALQISSFKIQIQKALLILSITMKGVYSLQEKFRKQFLQRFKVQVGLKKTATKKPNSCKN